jgi:hypothetical protein
MGKTRWPVFLCPVNQHWDVSEFRDFQKEINSPKKFIYYVMFSDVFPGHMYTPGIECGYAHLPNIYWQ